MTWFLVATLVGAFLAATPALLRVVIRRRLKGYRVPANTVRSELPRTLGTPRRVAVVGGGLAGVAAAATLGERGFHVTLFEAQRYLGGKLGSWDIELGGERAWVSHGFHAFFRHYYNLDRFLERLGLRASFRAIDDYVIIGQDGGRISFGKLEATPVLNLVSMARNGLFSFRDVLFGPARDLMGIFLEYEEATTFARYDHLSFADFDRVAKLPPSLKLAFTTFSRAFFSDDDKLSLAQLVQCFHFYYLGQDRGLVYDYPVRDYEASLWAPIRAHLAANHVTLRLSTPVRALSRDGEGFEVNGERFDAVVLATDVVGARAIMGNAKGLDAPALAPRFESLAPGQRYAVLRLWVDRDVREDIPVFVITDKVRVLDSLTAYHRVEAESADWVKRHGGAVLELHCYAVPEDLGGEAEVRAAFLEELVRFFPELTGLKIRHEAMQLKRDFTAFHVGRAASRPTVESGVPGLVFAGDWVKLPFPAMLLEGAFSSGLLAANALLSAAGLQEEPVASVPLRGVMAGMPQPPTRAKLLEIAAKRPPPRP